MPLIEVTEMISSRRVNRTAEGTTITRIFRVATTDPEWLIANGWVVDLPAHNEQHPWIPFLFVDRLEILPDTKGIGKVDVEVTYREFPLGFTPYSEQWSWDIVGSQQKIYSVWDPSYVIHYPATSDSGMAIGFDGERANGVSVFRPETAVNVTKVMAAITISDRYILESMVNTVNDSSWFDYAAGEVLYTGARVRRRSDGLIQVDFSFLVTRTRVPTYVTMYDGSTILVAPRPWDYLWFQYLDSAQLLGDDTVIAKRIKSIHIAQVYEYANFGVFNLGGPYG